MAGHRLPCLNLRGHDLLPRPPFVFLSSFSLFSFSFGFDFQYTMTMLEDPVPVVRATAVRSLRALLGMVTSFPPSDSNIFLLYIFPALQVRPRALPLLACDRTAELKGFGFAGLLDAPSGAGPQADSRLHRDNPAWSVDVRGRACR